MKNYYSFVMIFGLFKQKSRQNMASWLNLPRVFTRGY